jgi:hypothetical protein
VIKVNNNLIISRISEFFQKILKNLKKIQNVKNQKLVFGNLEAKWLKFWIWIVFGLQNLFSNLK